MARVKAIFRYLEESDKVKFPQSQCLMTISVGQQTHEDERFEATIALINASFGACVLCVDDSLQRHTMALNVKEDADYFYDTSIREGDLWLARNEKYYSQLTILKKIIRWDHWLKHPNFAAQQKKIRECIETDPTYKAAFDYAIDEFLEKYCNRLENPANFDRERARQLSFNFTLEECTALSLWPELQCHFEVYPNRHNRAIEETRKRFVAPDYPDLVHAVTIGFRNAKQIKPQRFEFLNQTKENILEEARY
jgi:hypothetical protein